MNKNYFSILVVILYLFSCEKNPSNPENRGISAIKSGSRNLPANTLEIIDFDKIIIETDNKIQLVDISNQENFTILFEIDIPIGKEYRSFQLNRFIIFKRNNEDYSELLVDIETGSSTEFKNSGYSTCIASINPVDYSVLYTKSYFSSELKGLLSSIHYRTFDGTETFLMDSTVHPRWCPVNKWFAASRFLYKDESFWYWEEALFNLDGEKIILSREPTPLSGPRWNNDGTALFYYYAGQLFFVEIDWSNDKPNVFRKTYASQFDSPWVWSFDGQYLVYTKWYEDGHYVFGNDILITDKNLIIQSPLIEHENVIEEPLLWTEKYGLITKIDNQIFSYKIEFDN